MIALISYDSSSLLTYKTQYSFLKTNLNWNSLNFCHTLKALPNWCLLRGQENQVQTEEVHTGYEEKHFLHKDSLALEHVAETLYSLTLKPPKTVNAQILEFLGLISELNSALSRKLEEKHPVVPSNMNYPVILKSPANFGNKVSEFLKCRLPINDAHRKTD